MEPILDDRDGLLEGAGKRLDEMSGMSGMDNDRSTRKMLVIADGEGPDVAASKRAIRDEVRSRRYWNPLCVEIPASLPGPKVFHAQARSRVRWRPIQTVCGPGGSGRLGRFTYPPS
jgi:hypothetical protein